MRSVSESRSGGSRPSARAPSAVAPTGELERPVGLVAQQAIRAVVRGEVGTVDREHVLADLDVDADLGQRRAVAFLLVLPAQDARELVATDRRVELEARAEQRDGRTRRDRPVAARDVGVADVELGDHLAQHVVEVRAVPDVRHERGGSSRSAFQS